MAVGVAVLPYDIAIHINDIDVTTTIPLDSITFEDSASDVSNFNFTAIGLSLLIPVFGAAVKVYWLSAPKASQQLIFSGYVVNIHDLKYDNGIVKQYDVECQDQKVLLQKSIVEFTYLEGLLSDIVSGLFDATYPDLSANFDDVSGIDPSVGGLGFTFNDENLLDALTKVADTAGLDFSIGQGLSNTVTFDPDGLGSPVGDITVSTINNKGWLFLGQDTIPANFYTLDIETNGNPGNCFHCLAVQGATDPNPAPYIWVKLFNLLASPVHLSDLVFDYKISAGFNPALSIFLYHTNTSTLGAYDYLDIATLTGDGAWHTFTASIQADFGWVYTDTVYSFVIKIVDGGIGSHEFRFDNIIPTITETIDGFGSSVPRINIGIAPNAPDSDGFDLDVDTSDEYAHDINLDIGEFNSNSITVTGGNEEVAIDWIYESDGTQDHFDLETAVSDIVVHKNTGSDVTPVWIAQIDGLWGKDELISGGGAMDVLYDPDDHWLLFDSNPANLTKSFRVVGTIARPVRVRIEDVGAGEPTFAETYYDDSVTSEAQAAAKASAILSQQAGVSRMTFTTFNPGLRPGTKITVTDTNRGLNESLLIQRVSTRWLGSSGVGEFSIEAGPANYASMDRMFADTEARLKPKPPAVVLGAVVYSLLIDADSDLVIDANSNSVLIRNN